mmetsp:Transcript_7014/g.14055  ORF Transcript_7014/g.14055 Transcript_7014/m.14055 type:complete len:377 (+) Transcript_7014:248-1378(+)
MGANSSTAAPIATGTETQSDLLRSEVGPLTRLLRFHGDCTDVPSYRWIAEICKKDVQRLAEFYTKFLALTEPDEGKKMRFAPFRQPDPGVIHRVSTSGFQFDLTDPLDRDAVLAACELDSRLSKVKPQLVRANQLSELEFFKNYFTHIAHLRHWLFSGIDDEALKTMFSHHLSSDNIPDGFFAVDGKTYVSATKQLSGLSFKSYSELAAFIAQAKPAKPGPSLKLSAAEAGDLSEGDKKLVMDVLRISAPTFLSVLLEEVAAHKGPGIPDKFWVMLKYRILSLSSRVETFTDLELLNPTSKGQESYVAIFQAANNFQFDMARDREAVQAAWALDPNLGAPFRELIPHHLSKGRFWNHYFHKVMDEAIEQLAAMVPL